MEAPADSIAGRQRLLTATVHRWSFSVTSNIGPFGRSATMSDPDEWGGLAPGAHTRLSRFQSAASLFPPLKK
jgi:hypothetical protein